VGVAEAIGEGSKAMKPSIVGDLIMKARLLTLLLVLGLAGSGSVFWVTAAQAETPYERDQREMLERDQREHGTSAQVQQRL
jgi:hypothetical protein